MNVLRKLHLYFAFGERMHYVSAAASQAQQTWRAIKARPRPAARQ
jgi:hypothetical protein